MKERIRRKKINGYYLIKKNQRWYHILGGWRHHSVSLGTQQSVSLGMEEGWKIQCWVCYVLGGCLTSEQKYLLEMC